MSGRPGRDTRGLIFDIDTFAVHDGPGIRMAVYFKGCPLRCQWCHSPESQSSEPELVFFADRCLLCRKCEQACSRGGHSFDGGRHYIARDQCVSCGQCSTACPVGAMAIRGRQVTAGSIIDKAVRMKPFFDHSGGGVTLTGGEVTAQAGFAEAILAGLREEGIATAIETAGACSWETLSRLVDLCDLVLYDIKLIDPDVHRRCVGADNSRILDNARRLAGQNVQIRIPLIPDVTDTQENLEGIFDFLADTGLNRVELLPLNPSAGAKYDWLDRRQEPVGQPQSPEQLDRFRQLGKGRNLQVRII